LAGFGPTGSRAAGFDRVAGRASRGTALRLPTPFLRRFAALGFALLGAAAPVFLFLGISNRLPRSVDTALPAGIMR
jgi:hypothetical protein